MRKTVVIIGNGFDLNLGLKTSWSDFIESLDFNICRGTHLGDYLFTQKSNVGWVDVEAELKNYTLKFKNRKLDHGKATLKSDHIVLKNALCSYLTGIENVTKSPSAALDFVRKIKWYNTAVYNFNYTPYFENICSNLGYKIGELFYVHGSIEDDDLIFGFDDLNPQPLDEHLFMKKSFDDNYLPSLKKLLQGNMSFINDVHIFGHGLGKSDRSYFKNFFHNKNLQGTKLHLYHHGEKGKYSLKTEINHMLDGDFAELYERFNGVIFHETK